MENMMRIFVAAALMLAASGAMADEIGDAHKQAITGRDTYWNCLAQEYRTDSNKAMSGPDFTSHIADVCPSERQNFRVSLVGYLTLQFPDVDAGRPHDDGQQSHRSGAEGHRHRFHQAQGSRQVMRN